MAADTVVPIGRPVPWREIVIICAITAALIVGWTIFGVLSPHPELTWVVLLFLIIPAVTIPYWLWFSSYAVIDPAANTISINGGAHRPLTDIVFARTDVFRFVCTLRLGFSPAKSDWLAVYSGTPLASKRVERDWVRAILPLTGLPPAPDDSTLGFMSVRHANPANLHQAIAFIDDHM